jgi:ribose-phosphate pyrophosphokinase
MMAKRMRFFAGTAHPQFSAELAAHLGVTPDPSEAFHFSDGNLFVRVGENVRGYEVFIVQTLAPPVNDHLMELIFLIDACKRASSGPVTAVIPYYSYALADKKDEPRVSIRGRVVADLLETVGVDRVLTMDLHSPQIQGFFRKPVDHLYAMPVLAEDFRARQLADLVVVSPDMGFAKRARHFARLLDAPVAIGDKVRRGHEERAEVMNIVGEVKGCNALIVDDIIVSGGSLVSLAEVLVREGAKEIYAAASHGVLSDGAVEKLANSPIKEVVVTDTLPLPPDKQHPKIRQVTVTPLFAEAIRRIHEEESVSVLFTEAEPPPP